MKDPLPTEFVAWIRHLVLSSRNPDPRRLYRGLILRWGFWLDGISSNKLPGYATCPKPVERTGLPAGWSYQKIRDIARETIGTAAIQAARAAATMPRRDCGSNHPYGICPKCGKAQGYILISDGKPTSLITAH
jgi:hypothetical protein